jgi:hypothetical protein
MTETTNSPTKPNEPACPECSSLASRVEELDAEIARLGSDHNLEYCDCEFCQLRAFRFKQRLADKGLAGAHAEEKGTW